MAGGALLARSNTALFQAIDADGSDTLDRAEVEKILEGLDETATDAVMAQLDPDRSGDVTRQEFDAWLFSRFENTFSGYSWLPVFTDACRSKMEESHRIAALQLKIDSMSMTSATWRRINQSTVLRDEREQQMHTHLYSLLSRLVPPSWSQGSLLATADTAETLLAQLCQPKLIHEGDRVMLVRHAGKHEDHESGLASSGSA